MAGSGYCLALSCAALILSAPLALGAVLAAVALAGLAAGVAAQMRKAAVWGVPLMAMIVVINALVVRNGDTVIWRLGDLPVLGHTDVTLEAVAYGGILALRALALILCAALYTAAVDPDEVLRLFRRVSFRSALTATLATRLVPVLARDAGRLAEAQRCRPGTPPSRLTLLRAATAGVMDRALEVAVALEVRGYALGGRPASRRGAWSRHQLAFLASAGGVLGLAVVARAGGLEQFTAYPALSAPVSAGQAGIVAALLLIALAPFLDRRGIVE